MKIVSIHPAADAWRVTYGDQGAPVACWALIEYPDGRRAVVPLVAGAAAGHVGLKYDSGLAELWPALAEWDDHVAIVEADDV